MVFHNIPLERIYHYLLVMAFFLLPLSVSGNNIAIYSITIIWLLSGEYIRKFNFLRENRLAKASIIFFVIHLISILWTSDLIWGVEILRKMLPFLIVLPILLDVVNRKNYKQYTTAFLIAICISEFLSYLIWFGFIEPFKYATINNPTPLMSHISYNPFLAFAIYLVVNKLIFETKISIFKQSLYILFIAVSTFNMFITGGRAGHIMFFAAIIILIFQYFNISKVKALFLSILTIVVIFLSAYYLSPLFEDRVQSLFHDIALFNEYANTSVGARITFLINSFEMFYNNPLLGVGVGDFPNEYAKLNEVNSPKVELTVQPHNMYMLVLAQLGIVGLISFLWIFIVQFTEAFNSNHKFIRHLGIAMPLLFGLIMLSDSYLLGHYTTNLYILFSAFIYGRD